VACLSKEKKGRLRWMKLTAVPLAPGLEEGLVALDARRMVDLRASPPIADDEVAPVEADEADDLLVVLLPLGGLGRRGDQRRGRAFLVLGRSPPPLGRGRVLARRHPDDRAQELRIVHPRRLRWRRESELGRPAGLRWGELLGPGVHGSGPGG